MQLTAEAARPLGSIGVDGHHFKGSPLTPRSLAPGRDGPDFRLLAFLLLVTVGFWVGKTTELEQRQIYFFTYYIHV